MDLGGYILIAALWLAHVVIAGAVVAPIVWFTRRRVQWYLWELAVFIVPFGVWFGLFSTVSRPKTLANLGEYSMISGAIAVGVLTRVLVTRGSRSRLVPAIIIAGVIAAAIGVYFLTPMWPSEDSF